MTKKQSILMIDDDKIFCELKTHTLEDEGFFIRSIHSEKEIFDKLKEHPWDLLLLDLMLGNVNTLKILPRIKEAYSDLPIIIITSHVSLEYAVEAVKKGAYDYISKLTEDEEIVLKVRHALEQKTAQEKIKTLESALGERYSFRNIIGGNAKMQEIYKLIEIVCDTDVAVLLRGETGTGKELVAKSIHYNSSRKNEPFIAINCASIHENLVESELFGHEKGSFTGAHKQRKGKIEDASGGTLFLDEIGDLPLGLQAKLLRFLQDKKFERLGGNEVLSSNARIIAATNKNIEDMLKDGRFREDLYYRLNTVEIKLPPLREKPEDIQLLSDTFLDQTNKKYNKKIKKLSPEIIRLFGSYSWPGNVRELENLIEKLVIISPGNEIGLDDVKKYLKTEPGNEKSPSEITLNEYRKNAEKEYLINLLKEMKGNITETAKKANIDRKALYKKLMDFGLKRSDFVE